MKKQKALFLSILNLTFVLTLVSCGNTSSSAAPSIDTPSSVTSSTSSTDTSSSVEPVVKTYTVTWKSGDTILETDTDVKEGTIPTYDGDTPTKAKTKSHHYTFDGWTPEVKAVTNNVTYEAKFKEELNKYTVTFDTQGGNEIAALTKDYGSSIAKPETDPVKEGYKFMGWTLDSEGDKVATFPFTLEEDVTIYAKWNKEIEIMSHLKTLLKGFEFNPLENIPEAMLANYEPNLVSGPSALPANYDTFVNLNNVPYQGFGEQWNMVLSNLKQTDLIFKGLGIIESVSDASIAVFQNYFDKNPSDSATHTTKVGDYDVTIEFKDDVIAYALSFTTNNKTAQMWINLNVKTGERAGRLQIGDNQAIKYVAKENSYKFAMKLANVRSSMFTLDVLEDGTVKGLINEHTYLQDKIDLTSAAQFEITKDKKVFAIGNKVEAMPGTKPVVVELYDGNTGKLKAYEVQEKTKVKDYNTLWFNMSDIDGINSVKFLKNPDDKEVNRLTLPYINNDSSKPFETKKFLGLASRYFDIELRDRFYTYKKTDEDNKVSYETDKYQVPMFFVQEEQLSKIDKLVKDMNSGLNFKLKASSSDIQLLTDYYNDETNISEFNSLKESITPEIINAFIGNKFVEGR